MNRLLSVVKRQLSFLPTSRVAVACSAHLDSTVLLDVLRRLPDLELIILHVNYHLRVPDSDLNQGHVRKLGMRFNLPVFCHDVDPNIAKKQRTGIQNWARKIRYRFFHKFVEKGYTIALAHHKNDLAENILMRLCRGAELTHLPGMSLYSAPFWRPFLQCLKIDLRRHANIIRLTFHHDTSNNLKGSCRNRIRLEILTRLSDDYPGCEKRMVATALEAEQIGRYLKEHLRKTYRLDSVDRLNLLEIRHLPEAVLYQVLSEFLRYRGRKTKTLTRSYLKQLSRGIKDAESKEKYYVLPENSGQIVINKHDLYLEKRRCENKPSFLQARSTIYPRDFCLRLSAKSRMDFLGFFEAPGIRILTLRGKDWVGKKHVKTLKISTPHSWEKIRLPNDFHAKRYKNFLKEEKIPKSSRQSMMCIADGEKNLGLSDGKTVWSSRLSKPS